MAAPRIGPDGLRSTYWAELTTRVSESVRRIVARGESTTGGRTIPEDDHLLIGEGRQLSMAVMFIDICGFSDWSSGSFADQEDVLAIFNIYFSEMVRIARDYGGEIEKNTGDGLLAYFDIQPGETEENTCKRSLACALAMLACTAHLINPILRASALPEVHFRVGMDFGPATVAKVGSPRLFSSRLAIGAIANAASKMLRHAGRDDVVIGNELRKRLPAGWAQHAYPLRVDSGFIYRWSGLPYPLYRYTGRWINLV